MTEKRFHFGYVLGDTGLIDEQAELKWFIENCCDANDLKKNWIAVCDKLNEVADENEQLKARIKYLETKLQRERASTTEQHQKWDKQANERIQELENEIQDFQDILAHKEEELLKPVIRMIDDKIEEIRPYNSELCVLTLKDLRKQIME